MHGETYNPKQIKGIPLMFTSQNRLVRGIHCLSDKLIQNTYEDQPHRIVKLLYMIVSEKQLSHYQKTSFTIQPCNSYKNMEL